MRFTFPWIARKWMYTYTHGHNIPHSWFSEKHFNIFDSLPIGNKKQMISHLKALKNPFRIRKKKQENFHPQCNKTDLNEKVPLLVRASFCALWIELYQFSLLLSKGIVLGFLKRYIPPSYLKGLRNGSWSKLEVQKKVPPMK